MKLTIVTPTYNQGSFIKQTFDSLLRQKHDFPLEYVIYDAVSSDQTPSIIQEYLPKFQNNNIECKYFCEKDRGQSDAINKGWRIATGDILTYLNSDDYYEPDILNTVVHFFQDHPEIQWAYGGQNLVTVHGKIFLSMQPTSYNKKKLLNYCNIAQPSCFFRKELVGEFGMLNEQLHLAMDYDLWLRFASKYPAGVIPYIVANMRYHADAKSAAQTIEQLWEMHRTGAQYTHPLSWRRLVQQWYLWRGIITTKLQISTIQRKM